MPTDPPSYAPKGPRRRRPSQEGAQPVGDEERPTRPLPAQPASTALPPSYAPGSGAQSPAPSAAPPAQPQPGTAQRPVQPAAPGQSPAPARRPTTRPRRRGRRVAVTVLVVALVVLIAWPVGLLLWANGNLVKVEALSGAADTPGTTYLLAGSDSRADLQRGDPGYDATEGARTDTILLLHVPTSGKTSLVSLPRDSYVQIPGRKAGKLNSAYAFGGPPLLVKTVEELSGLTIDRYVEIGFAGVPAIVDALGGVELCYDHDVDDRRSKLKWQAGCHVADGPTALAFSRMRYADREGDIGRTARQRQLIAAITKGVVQPGVLLNPVHQVQLANAGTSALIVDEQANILDLGKLALAFRDATGPDGWNGTPPITSLNYRPGGVGSAVQLTEAELPGFFAAVRDGKPPAQD